LDFWKLKDQGGEASSTPVTSPPHAAPRTTIFSGELRRKILQLLQNVFFQVLFDPF
jgi:hypothetical protein